MAEQFCSAGTRRELQWTLLFAREPESDLDVELNEPRESPSRRSSGGASSSQSPPPSRVKILVLILLLVIVAGGAYVAMDPELMMKLTGQEATRSAPSPAATARPLAQPAAPSPSTVGPETLGPIAAPRAVPTPLFAEGDVVSVLPNPVSPVMSLSLSQDAAGTRPGATLSAGATLRVLDAELHENTWVYLVRSDSGIQGWVAEKQLRAKP